MSNVKFLVLYLAAMIPTYLWRYAYLAVAFEGDADYESPLATLFFLMLVSYLVMAYISYKRGKAIGKSYLAAFPIVGGVFDLILVFIPFVPTVMNIITIVIGMPDPKSATTFWTQTK